MKGLYFGLSVLNTIAVVVALLISNVPTAHGGDRTNVRGMGMGRTSVAVSRGLDAVGINPANLAPSDGGVMTFTVLPVGAYLGSDFLTYDLYSKYFTGGPEWSDLADADKQIILGSFQSPVGTGKAEAVARLFGITVRVDHTSSFAFTVDYGLIGAVNIPREYARLLLYGNVPGSSFDIEALAVKSYWARSYTISYGKLLPKPEFLTWLAGGVGVKMIQGYGYFEIERLVAALTTGTDGMLSGPVSWKARRARANDISDPIGDLFQDPAGYGFGVDIGISGGVDDYFSFGISLTDVGWVKWTRDAEELSSDTVTTAKNPDVFKNIRSLKNSVGGGDWKRQGFTSFLPSMLRCGISVQVDKVTRQFPGEMLVAAEFLQGVGADSPLSEQPRLSLGLEYRPIHWLPIRTGVSLGGSTSTQLAFGLGFNFRWLDFDLGTEDVLWLLNRKNSSTGSAGIGMRFRVPE